MWWSIACREQREHPPSTLVTVNVNTYARSRTRTDRSCIDRRSSLMQELLRPQYRCRLQEISKRGGLKPSSSRNLPFRAWHVAPAEYFIRYALGSELGSAGDAAAASLLRVLGVLLPFRKWHLLVLIHIGHPRLINIIT